MKIYGHPETPTTLMVLLCCAEKEYDPVFTQIDLKKREQASPAHLARHPFGLIPVLEHDGDYIYEARAIVRYLDRVLPGPALTPQDPKQFGRMEQFIGIEQSYFSPKIMVHHNAKILGRPSVGAVLAEARAQAGRALDVVEAALAHGPYLAGEQFSLAEVVWMPYLGTAFLTGNEDLVTNRPRVNEWWGRLSLRPSWIELPEHLAHWTGVYAAIA